MSVSPIREDYDAALDRIAALAAPLPDLTPGTKMAEIEGEDVLAGKNWAEMTRRINSLSEIAAAGWPVYVTEEFMALADAAASTFDRVDLPVHRSDLLPPVATVIFAEPVQRWTEGRAIGRVGGFFWADTEAVGVDLGGDFLVIALDAIGDPSVGFRLFAGDVTQGIYGQPLPAKTSESTHPEDIADDEAADLWNRTMLLVLWRLLGESYTEVSDERPSRPARRRAERAGIRGDVKVVKLRRREAAAGGGGEETEVAWSHRWMVRGHWRNQWYARQQRHAPRYIPPHVKGPADKPLVVRDAFFHADR